MHRFGFEPLEPRALAAVTMAINGNGSLVIQGTAGDDAISIMSTPTGVAVQSASLDSVKARPALWNAGQYALRTADLSALGGLAMHFTWGPVKRVLVLGNGGSDAIAVDTTTQNVTADQSIDSRVILLKNGRQITDFASTALPGTYGNRDTWMARFAEQQAAVKNQNPGVVFIGDSLIKRFPTTGEAAWTKYFRTAMNLGMAGDTTSQVLYRVESGLLDHVRPKLLVLEIGTNNISLSDNAQSVYRGVQSLLAAIRSRLPDTRVLVCSILPRGDAVGNAGAARANALLRTLDNGRSLRFLDATPRLSGPTALAKYFRTDQLHLNASGYTAWADLMSPFIDRMLHGAHAAV